MIRKPAAIVAVLTLLNLVNYLDRMLVNAVGPEMQRGLGLSDFELGLVGSAFMIGYFVTSPIFGYLGDRYPRKHLVAGGVFVWSIATVLSGFAESAPALLATRVLVGVGEASYATLSPTIIDDITAPSRKNRVLAVFYVAIPVGSALGYVLGGQLAHAFGWRAAFWVAGGPGALLALLALFLREPAREGRAAGLARGAAMADLRRLVARPAYRMAVFGLTAQTFALGGFAIWAAPFLERRVCLPLATADLWFGIVTASTGLAGTALGGFWADRDRKRGPTEAALRVCAISSTFAAPLALFALFMPGAAGFFVALGLCELAIFTSTSPVNTALLVSVPSQLRAAGMALSIFGSHLLGDFVSPPLVGRISGALGGSTAFCSGGVPLRNAMLLLPAALAVSAVFWWRGVRAASEEALEASS